MQVLILCTRLVYLHQDASASFHILVPRNVRFASESGHVRCISPCLLWANSGHYTSLYSVTSSALARSVGGTVTPSTLAVLRLNQFELCGLLDWWRRNAHDACTI